MRDRRVQTVLDLLLTLAILAAIGFCIFYLVKFCREDNLYHALRSAMFFGLAYVFSRMLGNSPN